MDSPEAQHILGVRRMINQSTIDTLRQMRLGAMAHALEEQLLDQETYGKLEFEERLGLLVDAEWSKRQSNKLNRDQVHKCV
jgi:hypothetical protein